MLFERDWWNSRSSQYHLSYDFIKKLKFLSEEAKITYNQATIFIPSTQITYFLRKTTIH